MIADAVADWRAHLDRCLWRFIFMGVRVVMGRHDEHGLDVAAGDQQRRESVWEDRDARWREREKGMKTRRREGEWRAAMTGSIMRIQVEARSRLKL